MDSSLEISISLDEAESFGPLLEEDVRYGLERGLLSPADVIRHFLAKLVREESLSENAEAIALLLPDEIGRVDDLSRLLESPSSGDSRRLWMAICLDQAARAVPGSMDLVELVYEYFDFDESLLPFLPWLRPGMPTEDELFSRLTAHLASERNWAVSR
jgi:hypothetical protein